MEKLKKSVCIQEWGKDILADVLGALLYGAGVYVFAVNANFAPGGITGLAILVNHFFPFLPIGTLTVIINIPVILLCYNINGGLLVPVWSFYGSILCTRPEDSFDHVFDHTMPFLTLNAVDGTLIDPMKGY